MTRPTSRPWGRPVRRFAPLILTFLLVACGGGTPVPATSGVAPTGTAATTPTVAPSSAPTAAASAQPATVVPTAATAAPTRASGTPPHSTVSGPTTSGRVTPSTATARGPLTIFAASSLTDAFTELQTGFARVAPDVAITFNFEASSNLKAQLEQGAKADLYAPADIPQMDGARGKGVIAGEQRIFANNKLALIVPASNLKGIAAPQDLAKPGTKLILAASYVPIGSYARFLLARMAGDPAYGPDFYKQSLANIVSEEANTRAVVNRIVLGEGDAGIVYASDVTPAVRDRVRVIPIPETLQVTAQYPIAVVTGAANPPAAGAFIAYLLSPEGQATLARNGFIPGGPAAGQPGGRLDVLHRNGAVSGVSTINTSEDAVSERCQREWIGGAGEEVPLLAAIEALGLPQDTTRVAFIGADGYRREVVLAALRADKTAILVTDPDGSRRVVFPNRPLSFWIKNLDRIETR